MILSRNRPSFVQEFNILEFNKLQAWWLAKFFRSDNLIIQNGGKPRCRPPNGGNPRPFGRPPNGCGKFIPRFKGS